MVLKVVVVEVIIMPSGLLYIANTPFVGKASQGGNAFLPSGRHYDVIWWLRTT
jgi:hypothetical protein